MSSPDPPARDVISLIADEPAQGGDKPDVGGWMQRLCRAATRELAASGVGISVMSPQGGVTVLAASSPTGEVIEQLQFTLGEGPCLDAYSFGRPVLTPDLSQEASRRWPGYAPAAHDHGVRSVFAFPLQIGSARLGVMDVYREQTGSLTAPVLKQAFAFAEAAMTALLVTQEQRSGDVQSLLGTAMEDSFLVYQAQGMLRVQLDVSLGEALVRLRAYAYAHDRSLHEVAADVVARRVSFESER